MTVAPEEKTILFLVAIEASEDVESVFGGGRFDGYEVDVFLQVLP